MRHRPSVAVIGAGIGGLTSAILLAARGARVHVFESLDRPGGKANVANIDGLDVDTGPSVLTLPEVFDDVFRRAGSQLGDEIELCQATPFFRYSFADGVRLDVETHFDRTLANVEAALGKEALADLAGFQRYSERIWRASAPGFVFGPAPSVFSMLRMSLSKPSALIDVDAARRMWTAISRQVASPHLRLLLARYATYNGSSPYVAPATLNCIAHVELALGGHGVKGGIHALVRALIRTLDRLGVEVSLGTRVRRIRTREDRVIGLEVGDTHLDFDAVIANADAGHVFGALLPNTSKMRRRSAAPSMSGWTAIVRTRRRHDRVAHSVLFPENYSAEFHDIFERSLPPSDPTVYVCAPEVAHRAPGWEHEEPLFVMANAPAESSRSEPSSEASPRTFDHDSEEGREAKERHAAKEGHYAALSNRVIDRLRKADLIDSDASIVWERTPLDLARTFPGTGGAIYGAASHGVMSAFQRPSNRVARPRGLYLASGSAHPGGGLPLCALSGIQAATLLFEDLGLVEADSAWRAPS